MNFCGLNIKTWYHSQYFIVTSSFIKKLKELNTFVECLPNKSFLYPGTSSFTEYISYFPTTYISVNEYIFLFSSMFNVDTSVEYNDKLNWSLKCTSIY